ncbi:MAG: hypothetical protein VW496_03450 [Pelagibacteraceae bacterium]
MNEPYNRVVVDMGDKYYLSIIQPKNDHSQRVEVMFMSQGNCKGQVGPIFNLDGEGLRDILTNFLEVAQQPSITNYQLTNSQLSNLGHIEQEGKD